MSHRKRILKKEKMRKHMGGCAGMDWTGWSSWATQQVSGMARIRGREGWQGQSAGVGRAMSRGSDLLIDAKHTQKVGPHYFFGGTSEIGPLTSEIRGPILVFRPPVNGCEELEPGG